MNNTARIHKTEKSIVTLFVLILIIMCTAGCQPTPDTPVVIQKDNFEQLINDTPAPTAEQLQPTNTLESDGTHITWDYNETIEKDTLFDITVVQNTHVSIDAYVDLTPKTAPIVAVYPYSYNMDFIENAVNNLYDGQYWDGTRTKDDYINKILLMENALPIISERTKSCAEYRLDRWKDKYKEAPEDNITAELKFDKGINGNIVFFKGYPYEGALAEFYVRNHGMSDTYFYYYVDDIDKYYGETLHEYRGEPAIGMEKSFEDAKQEADCMINNIFGADMANVQVTYANRGRLDEDWYPNISTKVGRYGYGENDQCYVFYYTKTYNGVPQLYAPEISNNDDMEREEGGYVYERSWDYKYSMKWLAEYAVVMVDDTGIVEFWGFSPSKISSIVNDNVAMMPFEDILARFKQSILFSSVWAEDMTEELDIKITEIKFGMIRVPIKNDPSQYYMVPAWQFIGDKYTYSSRYRDREGNIGKDTYETGKTFMVLNALDGSIIDTSYFESRKNSAIKLLGEQKWANHLDVIDPPPGD